MHDPVARRRLARSSPERKTLESLALAGVTCLFVPLAAAAQMPSLPVLQNSFTNPGFTVAANYGAGGGAFGLGLAAAWSPGGGRFQVSGGVGIFRPVEGDEYTTAGGRVSVPVRHFMEGNLGVATFAGAGGAWREGMTMMDVPIGLGIGYRWFVGDGRGASVHVAPMYRFVRNATAEGSSTQASLFRIAGGVDMTVWRTLGVTVGYETGTTMETVPDSPPRGVLGLGIGWAFR